MQDFDELKKRKAIANAARLNLGEGNIELPDWQDEDAGYQADFLATSHLLADASALEDDSEIQALLDNSQGITRPVRFSRIVSRLSIAASVVLAAILSFVFYPGDSKVEGTPYQRYEALVGEQKTIDLSDGSRITLNTGSVLLAAINEDSRRLILRRGEAYFDVATDPQAPFRVDVGLNSVTVLGTAFNIRKTPKSLQLVVTEGVVTVHSLEESPSMSAPSIRETHRLAGVSDESVVSTGSSQYRVESGWVLDVDNDSNTMTAYAPSNLESMHSWRTGYLDFDQIALVEVIRELNRYSTKKILIEDNEITDLKVLAVVQVGHIDSALIGLEYMLPVRVVHHFDRIVVTGK